MFRNPNRVFALLLVLTLGLAIVDIPENYHLKITLGPMRVDQVLNPPELSLVRFGIVLKKKFITRLGLDLSGGTRVVLSADMHDISANERNNALESAREVIERRINFFGVSEPTIQSARSGDDYRIIVEMPGVTNTEEAVSTIGKTARMEFREFMILPEATAGAFIIPTIDDTKSVGITGKDLKKALVTFSSQTGEPQVAIEFTSPGAKKFADVTTRLVGKPLAIFLDDVPITWPRIQTPIVEGNGVITGKFTQSQARLLAVQLNAGALPVPVSIIEKRTVGATLGADSVTKSVRAGVIGLLIVAIFMIVKYGRLGLLADAALIVYGLMTLAVYRLIPVTLTLPGIAGFLLSIGMAVDSNILIFERYKEEKFFGKPWQIAIETAFGKAWDSIRDANITTILTCIILYNPGNWQFFPSSGLVRGFALTLLLGVVISLFTGIVVTRTFIRVLYKDK